jgi:hypothetical protein
MNRAGHYEEYGLIGACYLCDGAQGGQSDHSLGKAPSIANIQILPVKDCREIHEPTLDNQDEITLVAIAPSALVTAGGAEDDNLGASGESKKLSPALNLHQIAKGYRLRWTCVSSFQMGALTQHVNLSYWPTRQHFFVLITALSYLHSCHIAEKVSRTWSTNTF